MKKNLGTTDRAVRILAAIVIAILIFTGQISGALAGGLGVIATAFVATSFLGTCPMYIPLKFTTRKSKS